MANVKISQLTAKGSKIASTDRVAIAKDDGGGTFSSKYVTGEEINELSLDTSPQLGGDLDVNGKKITSASNGNIKIEPNGTGAVLIGGNDTQPSELRFMELSDNGTSYVGFKAPTDITTSKVYTLPSTDGTNGQVLQTNGSAVLSWTSASGGVPTTRNITVNGTTQDLSADRTYTVTDANLSTSDVTTNNVSTSKHGFTPKAPNDSKKYLDGTGAWTSLPIEIQVACSDETTALTTGTAKITFRTPCAITVTAVRASLTTAQASGNIFTVDINEGGTSILSTKLTIDNTELTSTTAATPPVISDTSLADDAEITVDIDQIGNGTAKGLKVTIIGTRV